MTHFGLATDGGNLSQRDLTTAMALGFLKVAAQAASDLRDNYARGDLGPPDSLVVLLEMMQRTFPDLGQAHQVICAIGMRCGFHIEDRDVRSVTSIGEA
jgi:hypothetical protein